MTSEIRVNKLTNRIGLSTVTFADSGIGVTVTGRIDPDTDSARDLGTTSVRWRNAYVDTYYGDGSNLTGVSGVSISSQANNRLITCLGTTDSLTGESSLTYDGTTLQAITSGSGTRDQLNLKNQNASAGTSRINFFSTVSGTEFACAAIRNGVNTVNKGRLFLQTNQGSGLANVLELDQNGDVTVPNGKVSISSDGTIDGILTIKADTDQVATPSIRLLDGSDTREVSISNTSGDFVTSVHGNDNAIHGHIKMFESGIFDINNGGASGSNTNRLRIDTSGRVLIGSSSSSSPAKLAVNGGINNSEAFFELNRTDDPANNQNIGLIEFCQGNSASRLAARIITRRDGAIWGAASLPTRFEFHLCAQGSNSAQERLRLTVNELLPGANNTTALGNSSLKWSNVSTNYLTCGLVNSQGSVASFKGGDYNQLNIAHKQNGGWGMLLTNSDSSVYNQGYHTTTSGNNTPIAMINVNNDSLYLGTNNTARWRVEHDGHFIPFNSGSYDIGSTGKRVRRLYAANATNTSDRNEKNTITESDLGLDFICKLKPVSYKWNQKEGEDLDTKTHYGLIAQDVEEVIIEIGKTLDDFGAVDKPEKDAMGLSYNELISPLVKAIQELKEENNTLRARVTNLEGN